MATNQLQQLSSDAGVLPTEFLWIDAKRAHVSFNLGRTTLARLEREGKIIARSLAEPGMARGKKLYQAESIQKYLMSLGSNRAA